MSYMKRMLEQLQPDTPRYALSWRMVYTEEKMRMIKSDCLESLSVVYRGLITELIRISTLQLWVFDNSQKLYKEIPFPTNWSELFTKANYGKVSHLKCPTCNCVEPIENVKRSKICELCYTHSGNAIKMEPFEIKL